MCIDLAVRRKALRRMIRSRRGPVSIIRRSNFSSFSLNRHTAALTTCCGILFRNPYSMSKLALTTTYPVTSSFASAIFSLTHRQLF